MLMNSEEKCLNGKTGFDSLCKDMKHTIDASKMQAQRYERFRGMSTADVITTWMGSLAVQKGLEVTMPSPNMLFRLPSGGLQQEDVLRSSSVPLHSVTDGDDDIGGVVRPITPSTSASNATQSLVKKVKSAGPIKKRTVHTFQRQPTVAKSHSSRTTVKHSLIGGGLINSSVDGRRVRRPGPIGPPPRLPKLAAWQIVEKKKQNKTQNPPIDCNKMTIQSYTKMATVIEP